MPVRHYNLIMHEYTHASGSAYVHVCQIYWPPPKSCSHWLAWKMGKPPINRTGLTWKKNTKGLISVVMSQMRAHVYTFQFFLSTNKIY